MSPADASASPSPAQRTAWQILAASAASFALSTLLPALPLGGVRGMLVVLPVVAALFASVGRSVGERGGERGGGSGGGSGGARSCVGRPTPLELGLWGGWILLALQHFTLGLPGSPEIVAAAGFVLAGVRTLRLAVGLRRCVAKPVLWPFFALPLALYLFAWPWTTTARAPDGDEPYYLLLTHSLAEDGDVDLADEYHDRAWRTFTTVPVEPQPGDPQGTQGELFSRHSALLPLLLAPLYLLAGAKGAQLGMLAFAAAAAAAGLTAARACYPSRPRGLLAAWMVLAFAPPLLLYAGQFWVEVPAALLVALICLGLVRLDPARRGAASPSGPTRWELLALAAPLVALPLLKLRFLALALPLGVLAIARLRGSGRRRRELLLIAAATLLGLGLWNFWRYGNPLRMYAGSDLAIFEVPLGAQLRGDFGLFFDVAFGLFALSPIWLLLLPALAAGIWHRQFREPGTRPVTPGVPAPLAPLVPIAELAALVPYLLLIGMRREWYGGWSPQFRYGVVLLPALALLLPPLLAVKRPAVGLRWLSAVLAALSCVLALVYLVHPAWAYSLADGSSRLLDELSRGSTVDLVRFFPSMVRARPATWIVPLVVTVVVLTIGWRGAGRQSPGGYRRGARFVWPLAALSLLLAWSALLVTAGRLPTARIEFEDAWVTHHGGALFPERWTVDRTRFDGGWALRPGGELTVAPVAGGSACRLALRLAPFPGTGQGPSSGPRGTLALEVRAGERLVATLDLLSPTNRSAEPVGELGWRTLAVGPFAFVAGESLGFRVVGSTGGSTGGSAGGSQGHSTPGFVVLDRAEVAWR